MLTTISSDVWIHNQRGELVAAVEVKNRTDLTSELAAILRRNLASHDQLPKARFFFIISEKNAYLWVGKESDMEELGPTYQFGMEEVVRKYLPNGRANPLSGESLRLLLLDWFSQLASEDTSLVANFPELAQSGFLKAIRGGTVTALTS